MIIVQDLEAWLKTLRPSNLVGVDDGGLTLIELHKDGQPTGNYLEIGGVPGAPDIEDLCDADD